MRIDGVWQIVDAASQPVQPDEQGSMPADAVRLTVLWYVIKKETYNWHIDGVLLESSEYSLIYSSGAAGTGEVRNMPDGRSLAPGTTVHVGYSLNNPDSASMTPIRAGYIFAGWQDRQTGQIWQPSDTFVLTKNTVLQAFWIPSAGHSLRIMKRDEQNDDPLAGAIFSLESRNESSDEWQLDASRLETQADGSTIFVGLQTARIYRLSEREEPPGYQGMDPICFRIVNENGTLQGFLCDPDGNRIENPEPILSVYGQTDSLMIALSLTNIPWIGHLMVQKTDLHGNSLYGAQYQLIQIRQGISTVIASGVSDRDGFVQFENGADLSLRDGTYRLEEIQAPDGCLLMEPVDLNIQDSRIEIQERAGITLEESEDGYRLIAADSPGMILPETGSTGRLMVILTSILCLTAALWVFRYKHLYSKGI